MDYSQDQYYPQHHYQQPPPNFAPPQHGYSPYGGQQQLPYVDDPNHLLPPNRGGYNMGPRPGSVASSQPGGFGGAAYRESAFSSQVSLHEDGGLLHPDASSPRGFPPPRKMDDYPPYGGDGAVWSSKEVPSPRSTKKKSWFLWGGVSVIVIAIVAAAVIYFAVIRPRHSGSSSSGGSGTSAGSGSGGSSPKPAKVLISGGDGSVVTAEDGSTFMYNNSFGGYWYYDPNNAFSAGGKANSWTPASNESWQFGVNKINGVNLGGWLVLEPFITPSLYQKYQVCATPAVDEWTLSECMIADTSPGGGIGQIEDHYKTFITEPDFAQIAGAGLNWVRIPFPFWAIYKISEEPFLEGTAWTYFLKAIGWARKYGLRINLDLHTIPGSQNGWNHSGRLYHGTGNFNFLNGVMGYANAQRAMDYIRILTEFISQEQYAPVIQYFGIMNEPNFDVIPVLDMKTFYYNVYTMVRGITGTGAGKGPMISYFHGFAQVTSDWQGWLPNADRIALDHHPYIIFGATPTDNPPESYAPGPCNSWGPYFNTTFQQFGFIGAGEFSAAINDCGLWITGVNVSSAYEGTFGPGSCDKWTQYENYTPAVKQGLMTFVAAEMDTLMNWFFWTWKIGPDENGIIQAPFWSYSLGLENGWIPPNPTTASGTCDSVGAAQNQPFPVSSLQPWQTGGAGGSLTPSTTEAYPWPPPTILGVSGPASALPSYTATGAIPTPPAPSPTQSAGDGWADPADQTPLAVPIANCNYPDPWNAVTVAVPPPC